MASPCDSDDCRVRDRVVTVACATVSSAVVAQRPAQPRKPIDRTATPVAGKTPQLHVPGWTKGRLANGAQLIVSERHNLPLVSVTVSISGGTSQYEPAHKTGVGELMAVMLAEGTTTKTGDEISNAMQLLGT